jgi:hypothetical protein
MRDVPSFVDEMGAICGDLRSEPLSRAHLNRAGTRTDQLGRCVHGLGLIHDHDIGLCLTVAVGELMRARGLAETERIAPVGEALRQLETALALCEEGLSPQGLVAATEPTAQEATRDGE